MFDVHINYSFYEKLVGQPKFILTCMCEYVFIFWELWMDYFVSILNMFWKPTASRD